MFKPQYNILLVEDDKNIREMIYDYFAIHGKNKYKISLAPNGQAGIEKAFEKTYDLLLLDVMLPLVDGFEICKEIRSISDVPIMFVTARTSQDDMLKGYACGCDDYIIKPIALPVLFEKVKAIIKRSKGMVRSPLLTAGSIILNPNKGLVTADGENITLTATEFKILKLLLENKNCVVTRQKILDTVWNYEQTDMRVLDTHIKNLRKALGSNSKFIKTVVRVGYKAEDKK